MSSQPETDAAPAQLLTRSRTEIAIILNAVASKRSQVSAYLESGELLFLAPIRNVDTESGHIVLNYGHSKLANIALICSREKKIMLHCEHGKLRVRFLAVAPSEIVYQGEPAIRLEFPEYLLQAAQRSLPRVSIPPQLRSTCIVECPGYISFEMNIVDISRAGMGTIIHDPGIKLAPGSVLTGCRIKHPLRTAIVVNLQILYAVSQQGADGRMRARFGCRFVGNSDDVAELVGMFSHELD